METENARFGGVKNGLAKSTSSVSIPAQGINNIPTRTKIKADPTMTYLTDRVHCTRKAAERRGVKRTAARPGWRGPPRINLVPREKWGDCVQAVRKEKGRF